MKFDSARTDDAQAIVRIFCDTFEPHLLPFVPLGCAGVESFLRDTFSSNLSPLDTSWIVARDPDVKAFAEIRLFPDSIFLNYLHVDRACHGRGIGSALFRNVLDRFAPDQDVPVFLDVADQNSRAKSWYERIGFKTQSISIWKTFALAKPRAPSPKFYIAGVPQAERLHQSYGFSQLTVKTIAGSFDIGRLGSKYFRATDSRLVSEPILSLIDPNRELLVINQDPAADGVEISRRHRMKASSGHVRKFLDRT